MSQPRPLLQAARFALAASVGFAGAFWLRSAGLLELGVPGSGPLSATLADPPVPSHPAPAIDAGIDLSRFGFCAPEDLSDRSPRPQASSYVRWHADQAVSFIRRAAAQPLSSNNRVEAAAAIRDDPQAALRALGGASDLDYDGQNLLSVATVRAGQLETDPIRARELARDATREDPSSAPAFALLYLTDRALHRTQEGVEALRRATQLDPADSGLQLELAMELERTTDLAGAHASFQKYLERFPADGMMRRRDARLQVESDIEAGYLRSVSGPVTLLAPPDSLGDASAMSAVARLVRTQLEEAATFTGTPLRDALKVVVYPGREEILAVSCAQDWANGLYDGTVRVSLLEPHQLSLDVLRHELMHAQALSRISGDRPVWFTEGLADYFAMAADPRLDADRLLLENHTFIPLSSLVDTFQVLGAGDAGLAYAESLALVAMISDTLGPKALIEGVRYLESGGDPAALDVHLFGHAVTSTEFLDYLPRHIQSPALAGHRS